MPVEHHRGRFEIHVDVLRAVESGVSKPTNIMYRANLSAHVLSECLRFLVEEGFLVKSSVIFGKRFIGRYSLSDKGSEVLKYYEVVEGLRPKDG